MNIFDDFTARIRNAAQPVVAEAGLTEMVDLGRIVVEPPRDAAHGDLATNAAMVLAKPLGMKPRELATRIAANLARDPDVDAAEVAGPGFINLRLRPAYWRTALRTLIEAGDAYGLVTLGTERTMRNGGVFVQAEGAFGEIEGWGLRIGARSRW